MREERRMQKVAANLAQHLAEVEDQTFAVVIDLFICLVGVDGVYPEEREGWRISDDGNVDSIGGFRISNP